MVNPIPSFRSGWDCPSRRCAVGATGSLSRVWTGWSTNHVQAGRGLVGDDRIEALITATLETAPPNATHWSTRSMAEHLGLSQSMVSRVWRAFGLAPHKQDSWKLSSDPLFVAKVRDVVGLYLDPPERAVVLCVDEKSQVQALDRTQPLLPMRPGQAERHTHDYTRHGTTSPFAALDVKAGTIVGKCMPRHRTQEFRKFLDEVERNVPADLDVHVVMDMCGHRVIAGKGR